MTQTILFIDADNQPPALMPALSRFLASIGRKGTRAVVAGNGVGDKVRGWESALEAAMPGIEVCCHVAPVRKQSADARLLFELAPYYHGEPDPSQLVMLLSRDDLLIAAAECLAARGHNSLLAFASASGTEPLAAEVPVVVLSSPQPTPAANSAPPATPSKDAAQAQIDARLVAKAVATIRKALNPNKQGGYAASAVGQVLAQLGHDKASRAKIIKSIPNLREAGAGPEKRLIF